MRSVIFRAGIVIGLLGAATAVQADATKTVVVAGEVGPAAAVAPVATRSEISSVALMTAGWIAATLQHGLSQVVVIDCMDAADATFGNQMRSAKPHQNPAFPAAFVFQSNSASYLAVKLPAKVDRSAPTGS